MSVEVPVGASNASPSAHPYEEGYDLLDLMLPLVRSRRVVFLATCVAALAGLVIALLMRPYYTATAVIMSPQQQQSSASALLGQLGSLGSLGAASGIALKNPADLYVGILQSRVIADRLIERFNLQSVYRETLREGARRVLTANAEFEAAKDGLIYIHVRAGDPKLAADLANGYVEELHQMNSHLAIGEAAQRRLFFDERLEEEKKALAAAEDDFKSTQEKTGIIQLNGQAETTIQNIARVRADIASREVELGVMRTFATDQNPDVARQQQEIAARRSQLKMLEDGQRQTAPGDVQVSAGRVPSAGLKYLRKLREVRYHESLYELLGKQQAAASLDEAKSAPLIQVVDPAEAPEKRSGPSRLLIIVGFGIAGSLLSAISVIAWNISIPLWSSPGNACRVQELRRALGRT